MIPAFADPTVLKVLVDPSGIQRCVQAFGNAKYLYVCVSFRAPRTYCIDAIGIQTFVHPLVIQEFSDPRRIQAFVELLKM